MSVQLGSIFKHVALFLDGEDLKNVYRLGGSAAKVSEKVAKAVADFDEIRVIEGDNCFEDMQFTIAENSDAENECLYASISDPTFQKIYDELGGYLSSRFLTVSLVKSIYNSELCREDQLMIVEMSVSREDVHDFIQLLKSNLPDGLTADEKRVGCRIAKKCGASPREVEVILKRLRLFELSSDQLEQLSSWAGAHQIDVDMVNKMIVSIKMGRD